MTATSMCPMTGLTTEYNAEGDLISIRESEVARPGLQYAEGQLIRIVEWCGRVTQFVYDQPALAGARL